MELIHVFPLITGCRWLDYFGCNWSWI